MINIFKLKKILPIIVLDIIVALFIALITVWLLYKSININNKVNLLGRSYQETASGNIFQTYIYTFFKIFLICILLLLLLTYILIKYTRPLFIETSLKKDNNKLKEKNKQLIQILDNLKDANAKLIKSEERYKIISDFSMSWEIFRHSDSSLIYCNPAVYDVIGYTQEEYLKGIPYSNFVHPDDLEKFTESYNNGLAGKSVSSCIVRLIHKNKTLKWADYVIKPVISENGELFGTRFSIRDITQLKEAEIALQESRKLLNLIFQYSNDWESYSDKHGKLLYSSLALEQLLGYPVREYLSSKIIMKDIIHPDDYEMAMIQYDRALSGATIPSFIIRYIHKNNNIVWVDVSARPVISESGDMLGVRFSSKDITKLKENEFELKELNATKDKFFSIISHDLRSPFIALIGYSELLYNDYDKLPKETIRDYISNIYNASKNTFELLENLLAWSRSQTGIIEINQKKINIKDYIDRVIQMLNPVAQKKNIELINTVNDKIHGYTDDNMLNTILRNLITNSIKYSYESGSIILRAEVKDDIVVISVSDNGVGMSEEIKNTLFKISETKSQPGTQSEKGTGLGLILCKEFVEKQGGKIWVNSEARKGTSFFFTIAYSD